MFKRFRYFLKCFIISVLWALAGDDACAQAGSLDAGFGIGGMVTTPFPDAGSNGNTMIVQADGKIVVAGAANADVALARYNSDGSLDNTFGTGGQVTTTIGTMNNMAYGVRQQSDGKIVIAGAAEPGASDFDFLVIRYNTDGSLDTSFGQSGIVETSFNTLNDFAYACAIQSDGKIITAGSADAVFAMARYDTDGSLDSTFGFNGEVTTAVGINGSLGRAVAIQSDGKIVMAGTCFDSSFVKGFGLVRYNANGSIDSSFGTNGVVTSWYAGKNDYGQSMAIQNDGRIIVAGFEDNGAKVNFVMERFNSNGNLDSTFGTDGKVTTAIRNSDDYGMSVTIQSDDRLLLCGYSSDVFNYDLAIVRYNNDGSIDSTFGINGKVITDFGGSSEGLCVTQQTDSKILVSGTDDGNFALARYNGEAVGIGAMKKIGIFSVYPNPSHNTFAIYLNEESGNGNWRLGIYDTIGRMVAEDKIINSTSYIVNKVFIPGLYLLRIIVGEKVYSQRIIIE